MYANDLALFASNKNELERQYRSGIKPQYDKFKNKICDVNTHIRMSEDCGTRKENTKDKTNEIQV